MPPLVQGLRSGNKNFIVIVGVVVEICGAVGKKLKPHCGQIMEGLIACLSDRSVDRETKPVVFSCIGDIAMALGSDFEPYFNTALSIAMDAIHKIQAIEAFVNSGDRSLIDFINRLQISLLEMYTGMIMGYVLKSELLDSRSANTQTH